MRIKITTVFVDDQQKGSELLYGGSGLRQKDRFTGGKIQVVLAPKEIR